MGKIILGLVVLLSLSVAPAESKIPGPKTIWHGVKKVCVWTYKGACVVSKTVEPLVPLASVVGSSGPLVYALLIPR